MKTGEPKKLPQIFRFEVKYDAFLQRWAIRSCNERCNTVAQTDFKLDMWGGGIRHFRYLFIN